MPKAGLRKIKQYSDKFKIQAVKLSEHPNIQVKDVAESLDIHPFMLSKWRKEYREGKYMDQEQKTHGIDDGKLSEIKRIRELEIKLEKALIENDLLKKAIRFSSEKKKKSSSSSTRIVKNTR